jgi:hypothetical protein
VTAADHELPGPFHELSDKDQVRLIAAVLTGMRRGLMAYSGKEEPPLLMQVRLEVEKIRLSIAPHLRSSRGDWHGLLIYVRSELEELIEHPAFREFVDVRFRITTTSGRDLVKINPGFGYKNISIDTAARLLVGVLARSIHTSSARPSELAELRRIIPPQKVAPIQFEIRDGRLALQRKVSTTAAEDRGSTEIAREELLRGGQRILTELRGSNCDRRLIESLEYLQDQLSTGESIIRVGLSNIGCEMMCGVYETELPDAVASMIRSHTRGVDMFAAQFPEWNRFVENAAVVQINDDDVAKIHDTAKSLVQRLSEKADVVDPEVPRTLSILNNLISNPRAASKRAAFAILRSIENFVSKVFSCGADLVEKTVTKTIDGLSSTASKALIIALLGIAVSGASSIGPVASKVNEMAWLKNAAELVQRQIERMLKE